MKHSIKTFIILAFEKYAIDYDMKHVMRLRFFFSKRAKGLIGAKMADESPRIYRCLNVMHVMLNNANKNAKKSA